MQKLFSLVSFGGRKYISIRKGDSRLIMEDLSGRPLVPAFKDEFLNFEVRRKGSIIACGHVMDSDYFQSVVFHFNYSEASCFSHPCDQPLTFFSERCFDLEDEVFVEKEGAEALVYDAIMDKLNSIKGLRDRINNSTQRFVGTCKRMGIDVTLSETPCQSLVEYHPGNICLIKETLLL